MAEKMHPPLSAGSGQHVSDLICAVIDLVDSVFCVEVKLTHHKGVDRRSRQIALVPVDLTAMYHGDPGGDLLLNSCDALIVKTTRLWDEPGSIVPGGEVRFQRKFSIHRGEALHSVLKRAGGVADLAFGERSIFIREELKMREKEQLKVLASRLQSDLTLLSLHAMATNVATSGCSGASASQGLGIGQQLLEQLKNTKPVGRLVMGLGPIAQGPVGAPGDVVSHDGDKLVVPKKTQEIAILGEVKSLTSRVFQPCLTQKADNKRICVVRANGDTVAGGRSIEAGSVARRT